MTRPRASPSPGCGASPARRPWPRPWRGTRSSSSSVEGHPMSWHALEADLRRAVRGEVRFDVGSRGAYSTDASNYRQVPIGVVVPFDLDDVSATTAVCREHDVPILGRGGGTSLAGQCCNAAVVLDFTKYLHNVLELDAERRLARVEPGVYRDTLDHAAAAHGLTFGPDPATHDHCAIGGMVGNNACGAHAQMAGRMAENVDELEVLTYDGCRLRVGPTSEEELERIIAQGGRRGEIYAGLRRIRDTYADLVRKRFPDIPRRVSGYCLEQLLPEHGFNVARALVGTESTCALFLEVTCRLLPRPKAKALVILGYRSVYEAADHVPEILEHQPIALEGMDDVLIDHVRRRGLHAHDLRMLPADHLGHPRVRARRHRRRPWRAAQLGGLGGLGGAAGQARRLPARPAQAHGPARLRRRLLRPLRPRLPAYAHELRPADRRRDPRLALVPGRGRRPGGRVRWLVLGRARRRPGSRRAAPQALRPGAGAGVPGVQGRLGPAGRDEPRQGRRPLPDHLQPAARRRLPAAAIAHQAGVHRGRPRLRPRRPALRGRRQVPQRGRRWSDVPLLHGHARGGALHARPRAPAVRDAQRRGERLAAKAPWAANLATQTPSATISVRPPPEPWSRCWRRPASRC